MRLKDLIGTIEKNCSSFSKREGLYLYKNNRIFNVSGKSINGIYHIYGKIEEGAREYSSHIKINLKTSKVIGASCSCEQSIENSKHIPNYICKHNVAVVYKLYELLEERKKESNNFRKVSFREKLKLDIKIKVLREKLEDIYYVECRVGKNNTVVINSLEEFLIKYNNKNNYDISSTLSYNPERYYFNEEDNKILELLYNFLKDNKNYIEKVNGRYIKVEKKNIYRLLTLLINRKIVFNYEYVDYNSSVILEKLPLVFSLKSFGEELILKTNKKMPIMLDEDYRVFFYHRNIYLLTEVQG